MVTNYHTEDVDSWRKATFLLVICVHHARACALSLWLWDRGNFDDFSCAFFLIRKSKRYLRGPLGEITSKFANIWLGHMMCDHENELTMFVGNKIELSIRILKIISRTNAVSRYKANRIRMLRFKRINSWNTRGPLWVSRSRCWSLIGEVSRSCLEWSWTALKGIRFLGNSLVPKEKRKGEPELFRDMFDGDRRVPKVFRSKRN